MNFVKMQAQGNDFIIINNLHAKDFHLLAKKLCDRHFGIGADGLVILFKSENADVKMRIFNSDGSEAEICGSALRCVAKLIMKDKNRVSIETKAGIKVVEKIEENNFRLNIGKGKFLHTEPITLYEQKGYYVSVGNPHFVIFTTDLNIADNIPNKIADSAFFKNGVNIEFVKIINDNEVEVRVFERGVGETLACGSGASAIQFVGFKKQILKDEVLQHFPGGDLITSYKNDEVFLSGKVEIVFTGDIEL